MSETKQENKGNVKQAAFYCRARITKDEPLRYISHLDYASLMQRAIRRAKLPAAYSEGFNPHLKVSFATALGVGVTSDCEYVDFELAENLRTPEVMARLNQQLPRGAEILRIKKITGKAPALMSIIDFSRYEIVVPFSGDLAAALESAEKFNAAPEIFFTRITPKHTRELEIKQYLAERISVSKADGDLLIKFGVKITQEGTVKPSEIVTVLRENFGLSIEPAAAKINRTALLSRGKNLLDVI